MPTVSIIIPTYGIPVFLNEAVNSVFEQTFTDWELIVVDDNDPNSEGRRQTEELLSKYRGDPKVKYLQHPCNKNGAAARNTGIRAASGKYISFLDSDDRYYSTRIEKLVNVIERSSDALAGGVYSGCTFYRKGRKYYEIVDINSGNFLTDALACRFPFCSGSNLFIKREIVEELNGFDETFIRHQDYEFLVRFFEKYSLIAVREPLIIKNNECINLPNTIKTVEVKKHYLEKFADIIAELPKTSRDYIYRSQYYFILYSAVQSGASEIYDEYKKKLIPLGKLTIKERTRLFMLKLRAMWR